MFRKTNPENAADIEALTACLTAASIGESISYETLSAAIGRNVHSCWWLLTSAREEAEKATGNLFATVRGEGVKRLTADEIPGVGLASMQKIRRTARRTITRLDTVRTNDLPESDAQKIIAHKSQLGAIALVADGRKSSALAGEVKATGTTIPAGRVLEVFKG